MAEEPTALAAPSDPQEEAPPPRPPEWVLPPLWLLQQPSNTQVDEEAFVQSAKVLEGVFKDFGMTCKVVRVRPGPVFTTYIIEVPPAMKVGRVLGLADDIARSMCATSLEVLQVPGTSSLAVQVLNTNRRMVHAHELLSIEEFGKAPSTLAFALGLDVRGAPVFADLAQLPHLLVCGTTGAGKSVCLDALLVSLLYRLTPDECGFILIDQRMTDFTVYDGLPHLLAPVITDSNKALVALNWTVREMESRSRKLAAVGARSLGAYNAKLAEAAAAGEVMTCPVQTDFDIVTSQPQFEEQPLCPYPHLVVVVKEVAELRATAGGAFDDALQRLTRMGHSVGIHLVLSTQRATVDVLSGGVSANLKARISFQAVSEADSRANLNQSGAELLLGLGDMLFRMPGQALMRIQGMLVDEREVSDVVAHWRSQGLSADMDVSIEKPTTPPRLSEDALYEQAVALVTRERKASTSFIQRHLGVGYNQAARLMEKMEGDRIVSKLNHVGKREVLAPPGHSATTAVKDVSRARR